MQTYFIADLHLSEPEGHLFALLQQFCRQQLQPGDHLYILGDLFAWWIGDDDLTLFHRAVIDEIARLVGFNIQVFFLAGNRDFLIGRRFAAMAHVTLLPEKHVIECGGESILLLHGDTLCTLDHRYLAFRQRVQKKWLQGLFLSLPLCLRVKIAASLRQQSQGVRLEADAAWMDVVDSDVLADCQAFDTATMIHGHTHRPGIHAYRQGDHWLTRYTLSDWGEQGNYLVIDEAGHKQLCYFKSEISA